MLPSENVKTVCDRIIRDFSPHNLFLFSLKRSPSGEAKSFKVCVVLDTKDKAAAEKRIYLDIDSEIPFDVLVYTPDEWSALLREEHSFVRRITEEGACLYGPQKISGRQ